MSYNLIEERARDLNWHFTKEDIQMTKQYMKRCSISLVVGKIQTKTQWDAHAPEWLKLERLAQSCIDKVGENGNTYSMQAEAYNVEEKHILKSRNSVPTWMTNPSAWRDIQVKECS